MVRRLGVWEGHLHLVGTRLFESLGRATPRFYFYFSLFNWQTLTATFSFLRAEHPGHILQPHHLAGWRRSMLWPWLNPNTGFWSSSKRSSARDFFTLCWSGQGWLD